MGQNNVNILLKYFKQILNLEKKILMTIIVVLLPVACFYLELGANFYIPILK